VKGEIFCWPRIKSQGWSLGTVKDIGPVSWTEKQEEILDVVITQDIREVFKELKVIRVDTWMPLLSYLLLLIRKITSYSSSTPS
jgi:hypothetical protein